MRIPLSTNLKTRTGAPDKDARLKNAYVESKGPVNDPNNPPQTMVRKRPIAQGGIAVGTGTAQGMIGFNIGSTPYIIGVWGDTLTNYTGGGTNWNGGTSYVTGDHVSYGFKDYWATTDHSGSQPPSANWSSVYVPSVPVNHAIPTTWTARSTTISHQWNDICWNGSVYCAVALDGYSATSTNGISWTIGTTPTGLSPYSVVWNGTVFCAVGSGSGSYNCATSTDGINWTGRTIPYGSGGDWCIAWNGAIFCVVERNVGSPVTATSSDGISWTAGTISALTWFNLSYGGGKFVASGSNTTPGYSTDGISWNYGSGGISSLDIVYGGGRFVLCNRNGTASRYSTDGISWSAGGALPSNSLWGSIAWNGTCFMAIEGYKTAASLISATSTDGLVWTQVLMPSSQNWIGCSSNGIDFVALAYNTAIGATTP